MSKSEQTGPWLIAGLGNPGSQYEYTRHNVGQQVVEILAARCQETLKRHRSRTRVAHVRLGSVGSLLGPAAILAVSETYMNVSGGPLARLAEFYKIPAERILVVHDDLDLEAQALRLKRGGGEGGHNGLKSLSAHVQTRDYLRLRIGIGRPPGRQSPADYVLAPIPASAREEWKVTWEEAADAVEDVVQRGLIAAQQDLHSRPRP